MASLYPKNFARFYDLIYHKQRDGVDNEFFLNQIRNIGGRILEIGVGTGRLFAEALKEGADIYGIDISDPMLEVCAGKLDEKDLKRISKQSIIDFCFPQKFNLIIAPFRVFMHLLSKDHQLKALHNVWEHLYHGGIFIFDTFIPDLSQLVKGINNYVDFNAEYAPTKTVRRTITTKPDLVNQIIDIKFRLDWDEDDGPKHDTWRMQLRYFFRYELEHLVERSAFSHYRMLGDYKGKELNGDSKDFIVISEK